MRPAVTTPGHSMKRSAAIYAALFALATVANCPAYADSLNAAYHGHDLGLPLRAALVQVQATGGSQASHISLSVSGSGDQLMFTEMNDDTIETETASYKDLEFADVDVRKVGETQGRYGITLRAVAGSVNDHIVSIASKSAGSDRDLALSYMDFWLLDLDMKRVRHLADLLATLGARVKEQQSPGITAPVMVEAAPAPVRAIAEHLEDASDGVDKMPVVLAAPRVPVTIASAGETDEARTAAPPAKCLFQAVRTQKHAKARAAVASWSTMKQTPGSGSGRLSYRISALHGPADHQSIQFYLGNALPVPATVVARVILTSSNGAQQAEDIGLNQLGSRTTKTDESLRVTPFEDASCITDVDVTELHACPLPDDSAERDDSDDIFRCNADAAAGTITIAGITYISGREPKSLTSP